MLLIRFLILSIVACHAGATETDEDFSNACSLLQNGLAIKTSTGAQHSSKDAGNFTVSDDADKTKATKWHIHTQAPVWPLVFLVSGTLCSFMAMVFLGHLAFPKEGLLQEEAEKEKCRDPFPDHVKFVLSTMVCFEHMTDYNNDYGNLHTFLHFFMMQIFVFYNGHLSRSYATSHVHQGVSTISITSRRLQATALKIFLVGLIMTFLTDSLINPPPRGTWSLSKLLTSFLGAAGSINWYIYALVMWRLVLPYWMCLKFPVSSAFVVATIGPCMESIFSEQSLVLSHNVYKPIVFFPFFVIGLQVDAATLGQICQDRRAQVSGFAVLGFAWLLVQLQYHPAWTVSNFQSGYSLDINKCTAFGDHCKMMSFALFYITSFACSVSFLAAGHLLLSGSWGPLMDNMSARTIYNYLGHIGMLHLLGQALHTETWGQPASFYAQSGAPYQTSLFHLTLAFLVNMTLTSWPVYFVLSSVCEPNLAFVFKAGKPDTEN